MELEEIFEELLEELGISHEYYTRYSPSIGTDYWILHKPDNPIDLYGFLFRAAPHDRSKLYYHWYSGSEPTKEAFRGGEYVDPCDPSVFKLFRKHLINWFNKLNG